MQATTLDQQLDWLEAFLTAKLEHYFIAKESKSLPRLHGKI